MKEQEGVIKYKLTHQHHPLEEAISILEINAWRTLFCRLHLIGQTPERYDGYGFGNMSQKIEGSHYNKSQFIITGTQTGHIDTLSKQHYSRIIEANPKQNYIISTGEIEPSSEALTHACVYQQDSTINSVIHVHSPEIWDKSKQMNLLHTDADITYGTPEMAMAVKLLFQHKQLKNSGIFSMLGHKDGVIAFADTMQTAAKLLIDHFVQAIALEPK